MTSSSEPSPRRGFLREAAAIVIGGIIMIIPGAAGLVAYLDPLRRKGSGGDFLKVASLSGLPADGVPRKFAVIADRVDAWTRTPRVPVGAVYLRQTPDKRLSAHSAICPHAGCFVDYSGERGGFFCPCHNSLFSPEGKVAGEKSPSPRDMDSLDVEVRNGGEIWVRFQKFQSGHKEKKVIG